MRTTPLHILHQGPTVGALLRTALASRFHRGRSDSRTGAIPDLPKVTCATLPPRPLTLVNDYLRAVGGDPARYEGGLPSHFFPQWGFPLLSSNLRGLPWDLTKALNAGARIEVHQKLPADEPLQVTATLESIDATDRRVLIRQKLETGTPSVPNALTAWTTAILPLERGDRAEKKERPQVPEGARELAPWQLPADAGLEFAILTGDINPIHWLKPYARLAGFRSPILHGFGILARAIESLNQGLWSGDPTRLGGIEARFVRPLPLPARPGVYVDGQGGLFVGEASGGPAYMVGEYWEKDR